MVKIMFGNISRFLANFNRYKFLLYELIKRDIQSKYKESVLGLLWSFFNPLLQCLALTIVFSTLFGRSIPNYPVYLLSGKLLFDLFANSTSGAMNSIRANRQIIKKVYVPKYMFTLGVVSSEFVNYLISLIVLVLVMIVTRAPFYLTIVYMVIPVIFMFIFAIGVGLILATLTTFFTDVKYLWGVMIMLLSYLTPLFYPISIIPKKFLIFFYLSPIYAAVSSCRDCILYNCFPNLNLLLYLIFSAIVALVIGIEIFYKYQDKFILRL